MLSRPSSGVVLGEAYLEELVQSPAHSPLAGVRTSAFARYSARGASGSALDSPVYSAPGASEDPSDSCGVEPGGRSGGGRRD